MYFIGIDCGTQSLRTGVFDKRGTPLAFAVKDYPVHYPYSGWAEQDARDWWSALKFTVKKVIKDSGIDPKAVGGISLDAMACTVVALDENGDPLRNALLWMDVRAFKEAQKVTATKEDILRFAGGDESPEWMIPKAMWLKKNEPDVYNRARYIVEATDYLMYKLTGRWTVSICNATCKWNYASVLGGFPINLLKKLDMEDLLEKWPKDVLSIGEISSGLSKTASEELGLPPGIPVAEGGIDAYLAMVGLNITSPGKMGIIMGSSNCHMAITDEAVFGTGVWGPYPDALIKGKWVLEGGQTSTGSVVKWFTDQFTNLSYEELDNEASKIPPGSEGLIVLEYWQGYRSPIRDPLARGTIWGLSLKHTPYHIFRAIYEGTAYGTRNIIEAIASKGVDLNEIYACGGGTRSRLWLQINADVCGVPIYIPEVEEAGCLGSAIAGAVGAGFFKDLQEGASQMVKIKSTIEPNLQNKNIYDFYFDKYKKTYFQLKDLMHDMIRFTL
ncbi:MAG: FGGY-family carbohydrate kinase [bacterium]